VQSSNLELKLFIVFKSWTEKEKLNFSSVANILKICVLGFCANLMTAILLDDCKISLHDCWIPLDDTILKHPS
jgi:hypothetical protein